MNVLIIYGTTEGQTRKIAEWTATRIRERWHQAALLDSAAAVPDLDFAAYDACIIAASVHQEYHQETITSLVIAHLGVLDTKPFCLHICQSIGGAGGGTSRSTKVCG